MLNTFRIPKPFAVGVVVAAASLIVGLVPGATPGQPALATQSAAATTVVAAHSGQALDVSGVSHAAGAPVIQWPTNGGANQQWTFEPLGEGTYRIAVAHSGQVLDVSGASQAAGAPVIQWPWVGADNQRWRIEDVPGEGSRLVAVHSGQALDVSGISQAGGARVIQWPPNGQANQRWKGIDDGGQPANLTQSCTHRERDVTVAVTYPQGWHVNDPSVQGCTAFDPEPSTLQPGTELPRDLAVLLIVEPVGFNQASDPTTLRVDEQRPLTIDGRRAVRQVVTTTGEGLGPPGQQATRYVIDGGTDRSILASTWNVAGNNYGENVQVLDAMAKAFDIQAAADGGDGGDGGLDGDDVLSPGIDTQPDVADASGPMVSVTDVRLGRHNGFDRMVLEIGGEGQAGWDVRYVDEARAAGSGSVIDVEGDAILQVSLRNIALPPDAPAGVEPWEGPDRLALPGSGPIAGVVEDTVFEGVHTFYVGVADTVPFQVHRLGSPQRVIVDVAAR